MTEHERTEFLVELERATTHEAAYAIASRRGIAAVGILCDALQDARPSLRSKAAEVLVSIGSPSVDLLCRTLASSEWFARMHAATVLGRIGDIRAIHPLCLTLNDEDGYVRRNALEALAIMGPTAMTALWGALDGKSLLVWREAVVALRRSGDPRVVAVAEQELQDVDPQMRRAIATGMSEMGSAEAATLLCRMLGDTDRQVRLEASRALGSFGPAAVEPLCRSLEDADPNVRILASGALIVLKDPRAAEALCEALEDENDDVRTNAIGALAMLCDTRVIEPLCRMLASEDPVFRVRAVIGLSKYRERRVVEALCRALQDVSVDVCRFAAEALGELGEVAAVEALCQALKSADRIVRRNAAETLRSLGGRETLPPKILLATHLTPRQRFTALNALRTVEYRGQTPTLRYPLPDITIYCRQQLQSARPEVREAAQAVLEASSLLMASQPNGAEEKAELLRGANPAIGNTAPGELLRPSEETQTAPAPLQEPGRGLLRWLRRG